MFNRTKSVDELIKALSDTIVGLGKVQSECFTEAEKIEDEVKILEERQEAILAEAVRAQSIEKKLKELLS